MKLLITCLAVLLLLCSSCTQASETKANQFIEHLAQGNYEEAKKISTKKTHRLIQLLEAAASLGDVTKQAVGSDLQMDCTCEEKGETANCNCCEDNNKPDDCTQLSLVKIEGEWLVEMKKDSDFKFD